MKIITTIIATVIVYTLFMHGLHEYQQKKEVEQLMKSMQSGQTVGWF